MPNSSNFPEPSTAAPPKGAEDWKSIYPKHFCFSEENKLWENQQFWYQESTHFPTVRLPFELVFSEAIQHGLGCNNSFVFNLPSTYGQEHRIVNGYIYVTNVEVPLSRTEEKSERFSQALNNYYSSWDARYEFWKNQVTKLIAKIDAIKVPDLSRSYNEKCNPSGIGLLFIDGYNSLIESLFEIWVYHFDMLIPGYAAYLDFVNFSKEVFPGITPKAISQMLSGTSTILFKPDEILRELAELAVDLKVSDQVCSSEQFEIVQKQLSENDPGVKWLASLEEKKVPWFYFSTGSGFYSSDRCWIDHMDVPLGNIQFYIKRKLKGLDIKRVNTDLKSSRQLIVANYAKLLTKEVNRKKFLKLHKNAMLVASYVEDHNFYIEHWFHTIFWKKMRMYGKLCADKSFIEAADDIFFLDHLEVSRLLHQMRLAWSVSSTNWGRYGWKTLIQHRKKTLEVLQAHQPPFPAAGKVPERFDDPIANMLFGIDDVKINQWKNSDTQDKSLGVIEGTPASSGIVTGIARVIESSTAFCNLKEGDILICKSLPPSWSSIFDKIGGAVSEVGGLMSHAAIVCREYGLPAVMNVNNALALIKDGDSVTINGDTGRITIN